jgi:oxaloacetate decarboxylase beta subunit
MVGRQENPGNFLIMHAMGPNLAGVFGTAISGGIIMALVQGGP